MHTENRKHPRFCPTGLLAKITLLQADKKEAITLEGTVVDISYSGIKIQLDTAVEQVFNNSEIKITIELPKSPTPLVIHGKIKHFSGKSECGLQYAENHQADKKLDNLMFECIKISKNHLQETII